MFDVFSLVFFSFKFNKISRVEKIGSFHKCGGN